MLEEEAKPMFYSVFIVSLSIISRALDSTVNVTSDFSYLRLKTRVDFCTKRKAAACTILLKTKNTFVVHQFVFLISPYLSTLKFLCILE